MRPAGNGSVGKPINPLSEITAADHVSPIQIASGGTSEHRLNRGGDRQLNRALHSIAKTRMERDPDTQPYVERRTREGLSKRRIRRCLKRYIARQIFRTLAAANEVAPKARLAA